MKLETDNSNIVLICSLGNPGNKYLKTRHNIGFMFADSIAESFNFSPFYRCDKINGDVSVGNISQKKVLLLKPSTYMNRSGIAVATAFKFFGLDHKNLIVVHDDVDIKFGSERIKSGGGDGGHNGINSICAEICMSDFIRIRLGIGRPVQNLPLERYVLSNFLDDELSLIDNFLRSKWDKIITKVANEGVAEAMNMFNRRNSQ